MVLFLAINTSSVTLLPTGVIALRAATGSTDPAAILPTTLFATLCSTAVAIASAKLLQRWFPITETVAATPADERAAAPSETPDIPTPIEQVEGAYPTWVSLLALAAVVALIPLTIFYGRAVSPWIVPGLMVGLRSNSPGSAYCAGSGFMKPSLMGQRTDFKSPFELSPTWLPSWWRLACFGPAVQWSC